MITFDDNDDVIIPNCSHIFIVIIAASRYDNAHRMCSKCDLVQFQPRDIVSSQPLVYNTRPWCNENKWGHLYLKENLRNPLLRMRGRKEYDREGYNNDDS